MKNRLLQKVLCNDLADAFSLSPREWDRFCVSIETEGLAPYFYHCTGSQTWVPEQVRTRLKTSYQNALLFKDYCIGQLFELQEQLHECGRVVLMKGLALCENIYREPLARPMSDIDLYLPDGSIDDAKAILTANGYIPYRDYADVFCHGQLHIDLHEDLWNIRRVQARRNIINDVKESFIPSTLMPRLYIPDPQLLALHTAYHGLKHGFSRKLWYLDMIMLFKNSYFDRIIFENHYCFANLALGHCVEQGLIPKPAHVKNRTRTFLLGRLLNTGARESVGEMALALSCPTISSSLSYFASSLFPARNILTEMYGNRPYWQLLTFRVLSLFSHAFKAFAWK